MEALNKSEKELLERMIRYKFDELYPIHIDEKSKCWELIILSKKLNLNREFIALLESDYDCAFNK